MACVELYGKLYGIYIYILYIYIYIYIYIIYYLYIYTIIYIYTSEENILYMHTKKWCFLNVFNAFDFVSHHVIGV